MKIKKPLRYDEPTGRIIDSVGKVILHNNWTARIFTVPHMGIIRDEGREITKVLNEHLMEDPEVIPHPVPVQEQPKQEETVTEEGNSIDEQPRRRGRPRKVQ